MEHRSTPLTDRIAERDALRRLGHSDRCANGCRPETHIESPFVRRARAGTLPAKDLSGAAR